MAENFAMADLTIAEGQLDETQLEDPGQEQLDKGDGEFPTKPWDPKLIRITTKNFTIREIFSQIDEGELDLAPDFQRSFVWSKRQQTRLIESILLGIPLPAFYFNQDSSGAHQVIDGVQRLTTVRKFMSSDLLLNESDLEYLASLSGQGYNTLDPVVRRRFSGTQIVAHVIEPQTPDEVKYDIFNRVNTGGSPLTAQEIRHCMSKNRSRQFLKRLVERESFDLATAGAFWSRDAAGLSVRDNHRMSDRERFEVAPVTARLPMSGPELDQAIRSVWAWRWFTTRPWRALRPASRSPILKAHPAILHQGFPELPRSSRLYAKPPSTRWRRVPEGRV